MNKISIFPKGYKNKDGKLVPATVPNGSIAFDEYLQDIKNGTYSVEVLGVRKGLIKKIELPGVTPSGIFSYRSEKHHEAHSGFIGIDIDFKDQQGNIDLKATRNELEKDPYAYAIHESVSGDGGLVMYVKINPDRHLDSFYGLEKYLADTYHVIIDKACKDVSRYRFVSHDPNLFINTKSKTFRSYIPKKAIPPKSRVIFSNNDLDHVFQQIHDKWINLTESYHDWFRIGCSLSDYFGEARGRDLFHHVSQTSAKYNQEECDKVFDSILKRDGEKKASIATFLWLAKNAGIDIKTPRTENIERIAKSRLKSVGKNGGMASKDSAIKSAIETAELEGYIGDDVKTIIEQVSELPSEELNAKSDNVLADLKLFINNQGIKFNEITRNYEINGEPMTDRDYNSIYVKAIEMVDDKITKDKVFSVIDSESTPSYHPFVDFFNKHKHIHPTGNFEALCRCIKYQQTIFENGSEIPVDEYLETYLKKWLLGIISAMHGTYSILILVLTGDQRVGKTKFFRNLLPDDLMSFYAESKLDEGKDSEILMTKKLIILDDEFGGKSKQDAKRLKDLSSKQWFNVRRPYGRTSEDLRRLAVLCGTSNEDEVINDPTGNRRIIPVNVTYIDHDAMAEIDKTALFMELYHEWKSDPEKFFLTADEITILNRCSVNNEEVSFEEQMVNKYFEPTDELDRKHEFMTNTDIKNVIEDLHKNLRLSPKKLGSVLKRLGFEKKQKRASGSPTPIGGYYVKRREND